MKKFRFPEDGDVAADVREKYGYDGDLLQIWAQNKGASVHKWHHYIPLYDRYFAPYRGKPIRFLEIGVNHGGSLQMWRKYFGDEAVIYGIDINPDCAQYDGQAGQVRIGSQTDEEFLDKVVAEMGGLDIVLDDGSHRMPHVKASLMALFPHLAKGGLYVIEDLQTAYFPKYGGGTKEKGNFFNIVRNMIDDMHHWYNGRKSFRYGKLNGEFSGIHIHDSMVVIEKNDVPPPVHSRIK